MFVSSPSGDATIKILEGNPTRFPALQFRAAGHEDDVRHLAGEDSIVRMASRLHRILRLEDL